MSLTNIINEWKNLPKTNLKNDIGVLKYMVKTNSTLKVYTFYNEDCFYNGDKDDFILFLVSKTKPSERQFCYSTRANKIFKTNFFM